MKKILLVITLLLLTACSQSKDMNKVCQIEQNGIKSELHLFATNDRLVQTKESMTIPYSQLEIKTDADKEALKEQLKETYSGYKGVDVIVDLDEEVAVLNLIIDYAVISNDDLVALGLLHESEKDVQYISATKSLELMENQGYTCK